MLIKKNLIISQLFARKCLHKSGTYHEQERQLCWLLDLCYFLNFQYLQEYYNLSQTLRLLDLAAHFPSTQPKELIAQNLYHGNAGPIYCDITIEILC